MPPRRDPTRPFRDPSAPADAPQYYCVPCGKYLPPTSFSSWAIKGCSRRCRTCACTKTRENYKKYALQNPDVIAVIHRTRIRARRMQKKYAITRNQATAIYNFWGARSAFNPAVPATDLLAFYPADLALPFVAPNTLLLTAREIRARITDPDQPLPHHVTARLPDLARMFPFKPDVPKNPSRSLKSLKSLKSSHPPPPPPSPSG